MNAKRVAIALHLAGVFVVFGGFTTPGLIAHYFALDDYLDASTPDSLVFFAPLAFASLGGVIIQISGRLRAVAAQQDLHSDSREHVLFLRSFSDDSKVSVTHPAKNEAFMPFMSIVLLMRILLGRKKVSFEEELVRTLSRELGPTVAIGRPGEFLPPTGAIRVYATDKEWKSVVLGKMDAVQLVVIQVAEPADNKGEGLRWEIVTALSTVKSTRLLFVFCEQWMTLFGADMKDRTEKERRYTYFRRLVHESDPSIELPDSLGDSTFLYFDSKWTPRLLPLAYWGPIDTVYRGCAVKMSESLQPFFQHVIENNQ